MNNFESLHKQSLKELHSEKNKSLFEKILALIEPRADDIAVFFYRQLLNNEKAIRFLNHDLVKIVYE